MSDAALARRPAGAAPGPAGPGPGEEPRTGPRFGHRIHPAATIGFLAVLAAGLAYAGYNLVAGHAAGRPAAARRRGLRAAGPRPPDRAGLRVRERLPRHRQRGGDRDLHPLDAAARGGDLVGRVQLPRRDGLDRCGGLQRRDPAAGGADPPGRLGGRLRDDLRAPRRGDRLEPRHLGARPAELLLARPDRLGDRRRPRQPADGPRPRRLGRRLGPGARSCSNRSCSAPSSGSSAPRGCCSCSSAWCAGPSSTGRRRARRRPRSGSAAS